jgi:hypothetical protein
MEKPVSVGRSTFSVAFNTVEPNVAEIVQELVLATGYV